MVGNVVKSVGKLVNGWFAVAGMLLKLTQDCACYIGPRSAHRGTGRRQVFRKPSESTAGGFQFSGQVLGGKGVGTGIIGNTPAWLRNNGNVFGAHLGCHR